MPKQIREIPDSNSVSVSELLTLIPDELIEELAEELSVDKWVRTLKASYLFKLIMFSLLNSERISLRIMEENFQDPIFRLFAPAIAADKVTWVGIRERLIKVKSAFFQRLYEEVYKQVGQLYSNKELGKYHIRRYDSTMIATFSHLLEGMKVGNTKNGKTQVKLTTEFTDDFLIRFQFYKDQDHLSEEVALKEVIQEATENDQAVHVFDRGLKSRVSLDEFDKGDIKLLTRASANIRYDFVRPHSLEDTFQDNQDIEFLEDSVVFLYKGGHKVAKNRSEQELRLIKFNIKSENKPLNFLTNVWDIEPSKIAQLYKQRWDIEVLFRFMKQEMNLKHFVCNDVNAIQVMLYCTMIASMLVLIFKKRNQFKSYKKAKIRFFKELLYSILLDALDDPAETERIKLCLKKFIQRE